MIKVLFFSSNQKKIEEVLKLFDKKKYDVLSLYNFSKFKEPIENGKTFEKNAFIKSSYGFKNYKIPCFADDSGICINALNDKPGIQSKRFIEKNNGIENTFLKIINKAKKKNNYTAYFQTSICLSLQNNKSVYFKGILKGNISKEIRGLNGFGYDPIFIPIGYSKTLAEMSIKEKNKISHRSMAIHELKKYFKNLFI